MAYNFTKLSDAELVESTVSTPNILIEEEGDIKRISADDIATPQVQADWNETDSGSKAFILNKPEVGPKAITYVYNSGLHLEDANGPLVTPQEVIDAWNSGAALHYKADGDDWYYSIFAVWYGLDSGSYAAQIGFFSSEGPQSIIVR
jgi:hypothetical protein